MRRFQSKKALAAYAGIDSPPNGSGDVNTIFAIKRPSPN
ncbi:MAG: hypothetical protein E7E26_10910 [Clostridiales bacterium]|nr:hypothetical protein [Clostridiales bacterium]